VTLSIGLALTAAWMRSATFDAAAPVPLRAADAANAAVTNRT
jgi:hypothetical protein